MYSQEMICTGLQATSGVYLIKPGTRCVIRTTIDGDREVVQAGDVVFSWGFKLSLSQWAMNFVSPESNEAQLTRKAE